MIETAGPTIISILFFGRPHFIYPAGTDATYFFENIGHTSHARELMKKYSIGHLQTTTESKHPVGFLFPEWIVTLLHLQLWQERYGLLSPV